MKIIKKFTALKILGDKRNEEYFIKLSHGRSNGPYYNEEAPEEEFDSEEEAIKYAFKQDEWSQWMIVPIIRFGDLY